jgi:hypothetical protein
MKRHSERVNLDLRLLRALEHPVTCYKLSKSGFGFYYYARVPSQSCFTLDNERTPRE